MHNSNLDPFNFRSNFDGTNFTRSQDKMIFFLITLKILYVLDPELTSIPKPQDDDSDELKVKRKK